MPGPKFSQPPDEHPPLMRFKVPEEIEAQTTVSNVLPKDYEKYRIPGTEVEFTQGPFGAYFTQVIRQADWVIGWLNFDIKERTYLFPNTPEPFIGLYCGLRGNIPCELHGREEILTLQEDKFGFYYVPEYAMNKADFQPFHYTAIYISLSGEFLKKFSSSRPTFTALIEKQVQRVMQGEQVHIIPLNYEAHAIIRNMKHHAADDPDYFVYQDVKVMELLLLYFQLLRKAQDIPPHMQEALNFIGEYFDTPITVTELAEKAQLDEETFKKEFKGVTNMAPDRYIKKFRIEKAEQLLKTTQLKIKDIVAQTGFTDSSHLNKAFKEKHRMMPTAYRKQFR